MSETPEDALVAALKAVHDAGEELTRVRQELEDSVGLIDRLSDILTRTALALHGGPLPKGMWSWHDLPELVERLRAGDDPAKDRR